MTQPLPGVRLAQAGVDLPVNRQGRTIVGPRPLQVGHPHLQVPQRLKHVRLAPHVAGTLAGVPPPFRCADAIAGTPGMHEDLWQVARDVSHGRCLFALLLGSRRAASVETGQQVLLLQRQHDIRKAGLGSAHALEERLAHPCEMLAGPQRK